VFWEEEIVSGILTKKVLKKDTADTGNVLDAVARELGMLGSLRGVG
jgi:hypothetical protein